MARTTGRLLDGKPIVQVVLGDPAPTASAVQAVPSQAPFHLREYRALLDTGADISCLCDNVVASEGLAPYGIIPMTGGAGSQRHLTYIVNVGIVCGGIETIDGDPIEPRTMFWLPAPIVAAEIRPNRWFDVIIGTDILVHHEFHLRRGGEFTLRLWP